MGFKVARGDVYGAAHDRVADTKRDCDCCGAPDAFISVAADTQPWQYRRCMRCGCCELFPFPADKELEVFYNNDYVIPRERHMANMRRIGPRLMDMIEAFVRRGALLEIGCSYGGFLVEAQKRGWACTGVEISESASMAARDLGLDVHTGALTACTGALGQRRFDAAVLWHVIEHVTCARELVSCVRDTLGTGRVIAIRTPNAASLGARLLGKGWEWFIEPAHVHLFSPSSIRSLLEAQGFEVVHLATCRGDAYTLLSEWVLAVSNRFRTRGTGPRFWKKPQSQEWRPTAPRQVVRAITDVAGRPIDNLLRLNGGSDRGAEIVAVGRRR